jgi:hypothetical protein
MVIEIRLSSLHEGKPHEFLLRFLFGGLATALAGFIGEHFGPEWGGLFLAFPAIFPASATLIESHEKRRKARIGRDGTNRGRLAASIDSSGAMLGCIGLFGFALVLWRTLPDHRAPLVVVSATGLWGILALALWEIRKNRFFSRLRLKNRSQAAGTKRTMDKPH